MGKQRHQTARLPALPGWFSLNETVKWSRSPSLEKARSVDLPHDGHYKAAYLLGNQLS